MDHKKKEDLPYLIIFCFTLIFFFAIYLLNRALYFTYPSFSLALILLELVISIIAEIISDYLTRKYAINSKKAEEKNPFAGYLYKHLGNKTIYFTVITTILIFIIFYLCSIIRPIFIEIVIPLFTGIMIADLLNDEIKVITLKFQNKNK